MYNMWSELLTQYSGKDIYMFFAGFVSTFLSHNRIIEYKVAFDQRIIYFIILGLTIPVWYQYDLLINGNVFFIEDIAKYLLIV